MKKIISILCFAIIAFYSCAQKGKMVQISTEYGNIKVKLYDETPLHRDNFIKLAKEGYFDGTLFHRIIEGFMIQGGDPQSKEAKPGEPLGNGGPEYTIPAEINPTFFHKKGALAAARMGDNVNPKKESSGSQFYIVHGTIINKDQLMQFAQSRGKTISEKQIQDYTTIGGSPHLDGEYTVFGEVVEGLDVIDKIAAVQKDQRDRPLQDIKMTVKVL